MRKVAGACHTQFLHPMHVISSTNSARVSSAGPSHLLCTPDTSPVGRSESTAHVLAGGPVAAAAGWSVLELVVVWALQGRRAVLVFALCTSYVRRLCVRERDIGKTCSRRRPLAESSSALVSLLPVVAFPFFPIHPPLSEKHALQFSQPQRTPPTSAPFA